MAALTLDHLSGGRFNLGLGVSGPQVVEGWYGQPFATPLARTREYVAIVRSILARDEPVTSPGPHYPLPLPPPQGSGLGKALRSTVHPPELMYHEPGWQYYADTSPERCFADAEPEGGETRRTAGHLEPPACGGSDVVGLTAPPERKCDSSRHEHHCHRAWGR